MPAEQDKLNGYAIGLSGVNIADGALGFDDTLWSGNATVTLVIAAVRAVAKGAGYSDDDVERCARSLRIGQLSGALPETHSVTTMAAAKALFTALDPTLPSGFTGYSYQ